MNKVRERSVFFLVFSFAHHVSYIIMGWGRIHPCFLAGADRGYQLVHRAAKETAKMRGKKAYEEVIALLNSGDLDSKINCLTLLNVLLKKAPNSKKRKKLIKRWEEVGLFNLLELQNEIQHPDYAVQLQALRVSVGRALFFGVGFCLFVCLFFSFSCGFFFFLGCFCFGFVVCFQLCRVEPPRS